MNWLSTLNANHSRNTTSHLKGRLLLLCCLFLLQQPLAWATEPLTSVSFKNRTLLDVLEDYEQAGYRFIFSSDLVRADQTITEEPLAGNDIERLQAVLHPLGLTLRPARGEARWLIVRYPPNGRRLVGQITDAQSDVPLADVRIEVAGISVYTDNDGRFDVVLPARYGDKMSGVIDISPVEELPPLGGEMTLSFLTTALSGYGSFSADNSHTSDQGRWVMSARRGNLDIVTDKVNPSLGDPSYSDGYGQVSWQLDAYNKLDMGILIYNDDVELKDLGLGPELEGELTHSQYENTYGWLQLHQEQSEEVYNITTLSRGSIRHSRDGFIADTEEGNSRLNEDNWFRIWSLDHRRHQNLSDQMTIDVGAKINYQVGSYKVSSQIERGDLAQVLSVPTSAQHNIALTPEAFSGGIYGSARFTPNPWLSVESGLRWDFQRFSERGTSDQISPRLSVRVEVAESTQLRSSIGRFYQSGAINDLQVADGVTRYQAAQHTDAFVLGLDHFFGDSGVSLRVETFYKDIRDPKRRYENLFNSLVLLPEVAPDRIEVAPDKARARGVETTLSYNPDTSLNIWLSYTRASADDYIDGHWQPRTWDQSETLGSGLIWNRNEWSLSAALRWHSGWQTSELPNGVQNLDAIPIKRNRDRLPEFLSLDVRASRTWEWPGDSLTFYVEVTNLLDRKNVGAVDYKITQLDSGSYSIIAEDEELLPLVPSIGIQWKFHAIGD